MERSYYLGNVVFPEIRFLMVEKNLTERDLAKMIGMAYTTLTRKLNGEARFYYEEAEKIADVLGVERTQISWLMSK